MPAEQLAVNHEQLWYCSDWLSFCAIFYDGYRIVPRKLCLDLSPMTKQSLNLAIVPLLYNSAMFHFI